MKKDEDEMKDQKLNEGGDKDESSSGEYDSIAEEVLNFKKKAKPEGDQNAIVARLVEKLKAKRPLEEGQSEEPLWEEARRMYWDWQDAKRAEANGEDEFHNCEVIGG